MTRRRTVCLPLCRPGVANLALGAALLAALLSACTGGRDVTPIPANAMIRLSGEFSGEYSLVDVDGAPVTSADRPGKARILYFGFANCPDVCPLALGTLSAALASLDEGERRRIEAYFVTVDPERDDAAALKAFLSFDPGIRGLTGSADAVEAAKRGFLVFASREETPGSALEYTMNHTSFFYLASETGEPRYAVRDSVTPQELSEILRRNM